MYSNNVIIKTFLDNRNLDSDSINYLLNPDASHQHDPFLLHGVSQFVDMLHQLKGQTIVVIPDYDADGV